MLLQQYKLKPKDPNRFVEIGQLVFPGNDSKLAVGFVSAVEQDFITITLFDQRDVDLLEIHGTLVTEKMTEDEMNTQLYETIETASPKIKKMWIDIAHEAEEAQS